MDNFIKIAKLKDLEEIIKIDVLIINSDERKDKIKSYIEKKQCLVYSYESVIRGFLIYHFHFFEQPFVELLMVSPDYRRKGVASSLLKAFENNICNYNKAFTSTNESNKKMQTVLDKNGYSRSGIVNNLDEGDPELIYFKKL